MLPKLAVRLRFPITPLQRAAPLLTAKRGGLTLDAFDLPYLPAEGDDAGGLPDELQRGGRAVAVQAADR
jgi:hypothetical protein